MNSSVNQNYQHYTGIQLKYLRTYHCNLGENSRHYDTKWKMANGFMRLQYYITTQKYLTNQFFKYRLIDKTCHKIIKIML